MNGDENHDEWLNLSLSLPPMPEPETQPSVSVPIQEQELVQPNHQGMFFRVSQYSETPHDFLLTSLSISCRQYNHNNQDQPSSSRNELIPEVGLLQDQYNPLMIWEFNHNAETPPANPQMIWEFNHNSEAPPPPPAMPEVIPEAALIPLRDSNQDEAGPSRQPRVPRRLPLQRLGEGKSLDIPPPYDWATSRRAHVYSLDELLTKGINVISGQVQCKLCGNVFSMEFDLQSKFSEVVEYIRRNKWDMHQRAPTVWLNPALPNCQAPQCGKQNCVKPVINKKRATNWLFLLLGQLLGCCKLEHLKYFCKHTRNHRTGAKDRVLYQTYMSLCRQLDPEGPFDVYN